MISAVEKKASQFARQLDGVIQQLMQPGSKWREKTLLAAQVLLADIQILLTTTDVQLIYPSPYFQFLLQQCSRYNAFFHRYTFENYSITNLNCPSGLNAIQIANIPLLNQSLHFTVQINTPQQEVFRQPHVATHQGQNRYFYDANDEAGFIDLYHTANKKIGFLTQTSNLRKHAKNAGKVVSTLFTGTEYGQGCDQYFSNKEHVEHDAALTLQNTTLREIEYGHPISASLQARQENPFYARAVVTEPTQQTKITHIGHATALVQNGGFNLVTDPVHYQSATEGVISLAARFMYARHTQAALQPTRYPGVQVVWISHNHHDHLCKKTLQQAFPAHTLFIVPIGDAIHLKRFGFYNVVEISAWGQSVSISNAKNNETLVIHSIPAKHASNRMLNDYMHSLYQGCLLEFQSQQKKTLALITGDTAVLDNQHYGQLEAFIKQLNAPVELACIASGPDRPRSLMECTHQSSMDAMVVQARLTNANLQGRTITLAQLNEFSNHTIAYHQGCFRLGLLSFSDVSSTLYRVLGLLNSYQACHPIARSISDLWNDLTQDLQYRKNIYYCVMDNFERKGILDLLNEYGRVRIQDKNAVRTLNVEEFALLLQNTFHIPKMGEAYIPQERRNQMRPRLQLHPEKILVNAGVKNDLLPVFAEFKQDEQLYVLIQNLYLHFESLSHNKNKKINFAEWFDADDTEKFFQHYFSVTKLYEKNTILHKILCDVHIYVQGKGRYDESHHESGNFETMILLLAVLKLHPGQVSLQQLEPTSASASHSPVSVDDDNDSNINLSAVQ